MLFEVRISLHILDASEYLFYRISQKNERYTFLSFNPFV